MPAGVPATSVFDVLDKNRFAVGKEIPLHGIMRLVDAAGDGKLMSNCSRRAAAHSAGGDIRLVGRAKRESFTKLPKAGKSGWCRMASEADHYRRDTWENRPGPTGRPGRSRDRGR